jgi:hypothetical protein
MHVERFFELVCTLVRAGGVYSAGWDPWLESKAVLDDLNNLAKLRLPSGQFPDAERTQARLALLSYWRWTYHTLLSLTCCGSGWGRNIA